VITKTPLLPEKTIVNWTDSHLKVRRQSLDKIEIKKSLKRTLTGKLVMRKTARRAVNS
jgi:hypothetical protein